MGRKARSAYRYLESEEDGLTVIRIAFLGDFALFADRTLMGDWREKFKAVADELAEYDLVIANLEVPITDCSRTWVCKGIHLKTTKTMIDVLRFLNVGIVSLANNHACDFGMRGLEDTIAALNEAGIRYYGVNGKSETVVVKGESLTFHGYCCYSANGAHYAAKAEQKGIHALTKKRVIDDLNADMHKNTLSILSMHWGDEYSNLPNKKQVWFMHSLVAEYKFILHGHHTHAMQGIEKCGESLLVYSQGNFCFDEVHSTVNKRQWIRQSDVNAESYIAAIEIEDRKIVDWHTIGLFNEETRLWVIDNREKIDAFSNMIKYCEESWYEAQSNEMIRTQKKKNLGKKDFAWLVSKMNYYSIGAKLLWCRNNRLYHDAY